MDKSGFFSSLGAYLKANRTFFLVALLILVSSFGYFWYRSGFTLDVNKFFASSGYCQVDSDCDSNEYCDADTCVPKIVGTGLCSSAAECGDNNGCTADACANPGTPDSVCVYTQIPGCGVSGNSCEDTPDQVCRFGVSCGQGFVDGVGTCSEQNTRCCKVSTTPVCGDGNCRAPDETNANCPADCPTVTDLCSGGDCLQVCGGGFPVDSGRSCGAAGRCCMPSSASTTCDKANINHGVPSINVSGNPATAWVTNNNGVACTISLASYNIRSDLGGTAPHYIQTQTLFRSTTVTVGAGQTANLSVGLPDCYSQVDLIIGEPIVPPNYSPGYFLGVENWDVGDPDGTQRYCNEGGAMPTPTPTVTTTVTPTPTPSTTTTPPPMVCTPATQLVALGAPATIVGSGGTTRSYGWYAPGSNPTTGGGATFIATYTVPGEKTVTMVSGGNQITCQVIVQPATPTPTPSLSVSPTPTPTGSATPTPTVPLLTLQKMVRNITQGSAEGDSANANPTDTVEFSLRVSSVGTGAVLGVSVRDALPAGLSYIPGSTTVDGAPASDGVVSTGLNLGDMSPGRTITIRFRATVAPATFFASGTSVLTNTGYARGSNAPEVSDVAFVTIVNAPQNLTMSLVKMGRNITRGETGERTPVHASPGQTIEFVLRVRNTSNAPLTNVMLRDVVPTGITAILGSVRIGGSSASDALFGAGLNLGTLAIGQEVVVVFAGRVVNASELPAGVTTLINTVQASATGVPTLTAQLPVIITNSTVVVPPVDTGPGESTMLALIISGIMTLLYVGYTSTDTYRRHEAGELAKGSKDEPFNFGR